ncbi:hypothetical protein Leryth_018231, partial [Lithospermum erythrorhizon]
LSRVNIRNLFGSSNYLHLSISSIFFLKDSLLIFNFRLSRLKRCLVKFLVNLNEA